MSTEDHIRPRVFRSVCIQTDRETFIKSDEVKGGQSRIVDFQQSVSKNPDLSLTKNLNLTGKENMVPPPPPPPAFLQLELDSMVPPPPPPPPPPGPCAPTISLLLPQPLDVPGSTPPPPPPPPDMMCLPPPPPVLHSVPPPPPGGAVYLSQVPDNTLRKQSVEPVCPMKPLYWTRIQIQENRYYSEIIPTYIF